MGLIAIGHLIATGIVEFLAPTKIGQFSIEKLDAMFRSLERVGNYNSAAGDIKLEKDDCMETNVFQSLVFWLVLIDMHILRVVASTILVQFHKKPIECEDIVKSIQEWRRMLRSVRLAGQSTTCHESFEDYGWKGDFDETQTSTPSTTYSRRKRSLEMMNGTFSATDLDSTCVPSLRSLADSPSMHNRRMNSPIPTNGSQISDLNTSTDDTFASANCESYADETADSQIFSEAIDVAVTNEYV